VRCVARRGWLFGAALVKTVIRLGNCGAQTAANQTVKRGEPFAVVKSAR